ncbi:MAG TPA: ABC transporter transmembrane domain-containing protein, partial [Polyangiales bacterium]|nr:ABC transporter transmembrane domain-containing protein [Polyangiales bacterium]
MSTNEPSPNPKPAGRNTRAAAAVKAFHEEERYGKDIYDWKLVKKMWPFLAPHRTLLVVSMVVIVFTAGGALVRPLIMRSAMDDGVGAGNGHKLMQAGLLLASVLVIEQVLGFVQMYAMQVAGARAMADLRARVFGFLHTRRLGFFDRTPVGRLVTRVTNDVDAIGEMFAS